MKKLTEMIIKQRIRSCVTDIEKIEQINLTGRDLEDISILRRMKNVEILSLSFNKITSLVDFQFCENLRELYLRRNNIKDLSEIYYLKGLPNLKKLMLSENPCADDPMYRQTIITNLENLETLDEIPITLEERRIAVKTSEEFLRQLLGKKSREGSTVEIMKRTEAINDDEFNYPLITAVESKNRILKKNMKNTLIIESTANALGSRKSSKDVLRSELKKSLSKITDDKILTSKFYHNELCDNTVINPDAKPLFASQNPNIISAILSLVKELDYSSLLVVNSEVNSRLSNMEAAYSSTRIPL